MQIAKLTENGKASQVAIAPDGRYIVYAMRDAEKQSLWVRNVATKSDVQVLAPDVVEFVGLNFSPDGNYIYFVRSDKTTENYRYLYQMPVLGGSPRQLVRDIDAPIDFSPDGTHFVFQRGVPSQNVIEIRIAPTDGAGERLLATLPANPNFQFGPTWSPDGNTIAIPTLGVGSQSNWQLNLITVADGRVRSLLSSGGKQVGRAVWMPDGNSLIAPVGETTFGRSQLQSIDYPRGELHRFTNDLSDYDPDLDVTRDGKTLAAIQRTRTSDIWAAPAGDSSQARQITSGEPAYDRLAIGPSGKLLAVSRNGDVWLMNSDGAAPAALVPQASNVRSVSSCGDRYVVYDSYREGKLELWRADADGSNARKLVDQAGDSDCSLDGKWAFYGNKDKVYRVSTEGGDPVALVTVPQGAYGLRVSPDGARVAFAYQEGTPVPTPKLGMVAATGGALQFVAQVPLGSRGLCLVAFRKSSPVRADQKRRFQHLGTAPDRRTRPTAHQIHFRPDCQLRLVARRQAVAPHPLQPNQRRNPDQQLPLAPGGLAHPFPKSGHSEAAPPLRFLQGWEMFAAERQRGSNLLPS